MQISPKQKDEACVDPVLGGGEKEGMPENLSTGVNNKLKKRKKGLEPFKDRIDDLNANEDMAEQSLHPNKLASSSYLSKGLDEAPLRYFPAMGFFILNQTLS